MAASGNKFVLPATEGLKEGREMLQGNMGVDFVGFSIQPNKPRATVVFFGGDRCTDLAQAGTEDGDAILKFENWVNVVRLLSAKFKDWQGSSQGEMVEGHGVDVIVVEPTRVEDGVWSCYDTFMPSTRSGEPARGYLREGRGGKHLESLILLTQRKALPNGTRGDGDPAPVILVGFSKGGVVLNQLLTEMAVDGDGTAGGARGLGGREGGLRVHEVHYVDVGLNCRGAYLTDPATLKGLASKGGGEGRLRIALHGTPRQWEDKGWLSGARGCVPRVEVTGSACRRRAWVAEEKGRMLRLCREEGVAAGSRVYFEGRAASLSMHFHCIEAFDIAVANGEP